MKLTNAQALDAYEAMGKLLDKELPVLLSFKFAEVVLKLEDKAKAFQVALNKAKERMSNPDEALTQDDILVLLSQETEVDITPIPAKDIENLDSLSMRTVLALKPIMEG